MFEGTSKKICVAGAGFVLAAGMAGALMAQPAQAATIKATSGASVYTIKSGATLSKYDINGDGAKDTISYTATANKYDKSTFSKFVLKINGMTKTVIKNDYFYTPEVTLLRFANGTSFVSVKLPQDNDYNVGGLYTCTSSKIVQVFDTTDNTFGKYGSHQVGEITKISGNYMAVKYTVQPYATGIISYKYTYKASGNSVKRTSGFTSAKASFAKTTSSGTYKRVAWSPTTKKVKLFTGASCTKYSYLAKGTSAKVIGVYIYGSKSLIKIQTYQGKVGFVNAAGYTASSTALFKYATFAG